MSAEDADDRVIEISVTMLNSALSGFTDILG
jgi:hypothetical protein